MSWVLVVIFLSGGDITVTSPPKFNSMEACFAAREIIVEELGRPIYNYQAVCIPQVQEV